MWTKNHPKMCLLRQVIRSGKEIQEHSIIMGQDMRKPRVLKDCITVCHALYKSAMNIDECKCQHVTAVSADLQYRYRYSVLTVLKCVQVMCSVEL